MGPELADMEIWKDYLAKYYPNISEFKRAEIILKSWIYLQLELDILGS